MKDQISEADHEKYKEEVRSLVEEAGEKANLFAREKLQPHFQNFQNVGVHVSKTNIISFKRGEDLFREYYHPASKNIFSATGSLIKRYLEVHSKTGVSLRNFIYINIMHEFAHHLQHQYTVEKRIFTLNPEKQFKSRREWLEDCGDYLAGALLASLESTNISDAEFQSIRHAYFLLGVKAGLYSHSSVQRAIFAYKRRVNRKLSGHNTQAQRAEFFEKGYREKRIVDALKTNPMKPFKLESSATSA